MNISTNFPIEFSYNGKKAWFGNYDKYNWTAQVRIKKYNKILTLYGYQSEPYKIAAQIGRKTLHVCKSNLQKCIRRQDSDRAITTALAIYSHDPSELLRRIPAIFNEDCLLHPPTYIKIIWWMAAVSKGFKLSKHELEELLGIILLMCNSQTYDVCQLKSIYGYNHDKLTDSQRDFLYAMELRIHYGGMYCDKQMFAYHIGLWSHRFLLKDSSWWDRICNQTEYEIDLDSVETLKKDDLLLESFDHHCYHIIIIKIKDKFEDLTDDQIKSAIWDCRSRLNYRTPHEENLFRPATDKTKANYAKIKNELIGLTTWIKNKIILTE